MSNFKDDLREVLKDIMSKADNYNGLEEEYENAALDTAQSQITKLVEGLKNGAYKSGYHDALNNRPFKIRERLR